MKRYKPLFESLEHDIKSFNGSEKSLEILTNWIDSLDLKSGKAPKGMAKQYANIKFIQKQLDMNKQFGKNAGIDNIKATVQHLTDEDIKKLTTALSKENKGTTELQLKNAIFHNESIISESKFKDISEDIDKFLSKLTDFHKKTLSPELHIYFVKKELSNAKAKYKRDKDAIYIRPDRVKIGNEYASFNYVVVHELGHRYLANNRVKFDYDASEWITTPYSKTDSMSGEEKFAELFALSFFNYSGKPFDDYKEKIEKFEGVMK